jgi:DNA-binding IscR family transcriptional regulator
MFAPEKVRLAVDLIRFLRDTPNNSPQKVETIALKLGTTKNYLHQVVGPVGQAGMISVIKGPGGGVLANLSEVSLLDIYNLFGYLNSLTGEPVHPIEVAIKQAFKNIKV